MSELKNLSAILEGGAVPAGYNGKAIGKLSKTHPSRARIEGLRKNLPARRRKQNRFLQDYSGAATLL